MSTFALNLREAAGFRTFVRPIVGIAMWPDASAAGIDM